MGLYYVQLGTTEERAKNFFEKLYKRGIQWRNEVEWMMICGPYLSGKSSIMQRISKECKQGNDVQGFISTSGSKLTGVQILPANVFGNGDEWLSRTVKYMHTTKLLQRNNASIEQLGAKMALDVVIELACGLIEWLNFGFTENNPMLHKMMRDNNSIDELIKRYINTSAGWCRGDRIGKDWRCILWLPDFEKHIASVCKPFQKKEDLIKELEDSIDIVLNSIKKGFKEFKDAFQKRTKTILDLKDIELSLLVGCECGCYVGTKCHLLEMEIEKINKQCPMISSGIPKYNFQYLDSTKSWASIKTMIALGGVETRCSQTCPICDGNLDKMASWNSGEYSLGVQQTIMESCQECEQDGINDITSRIPCVQNKACISITKKFLQRSTHLMNIILKHSIFKKGDNQEIQQLSEKIANNLFNAPASFKDGDIWPYPVSKKAFGVKNAKDALGILTTLGFVTSHSNKYKKNLGIFDKSSWS